MTPLLDYDTLDEAGIDQLVEHAIAGGVRGVFILGTTGEAPSLSYRLRREYIQLVCRKVKRRVRVLVGITDTAFVESVELAKVAKESGADSLVLATPYYFPAGQTELIQYISHLAPKLPLPLMLYNMPSLTKVWFDIESLEKLAQFDQIIGVKDSSGDLEYYKRLVGLKETRPDWSMLIGPEHLLVESLKMGGDGGVSGGANIFPELFVQTYEAARAGDKQRTEQLQQLIEKLQEIYTIGKYASRFIKATKSAVSLRGICSDKMAEPFIHFLPPERKRVAAILDKLTPELNSLLEG